MLELEKVLRIVRNSKEIISLLRNNALDVTSIYIALRKEQSAVSQKLNKMRSIGLVSVEVKGKQRIYSLNYILLNLIEDFEKETKKYLNDLC